MPVGRGSIERAANAGSGRNPVQKSRKKEQDILTDILIESIVPVPVSWTDYHSTEYKLAELTESILKYGMIEPIIVRRIQENQFQILSGYRRLKAVTELGERSISAKILEGLGEEEAREIFRELHKKKEPRGIHEEKFRMISGISRELPDYLL